LKSWLLSRLIVELSFDEAKIADVEKRLDKMDDRQVRILIDVYKDRVAKRDAAEAARKQYMEQTVLNQAKLDLQRAQGYKEYLQREYQRQILQGQMEQNLVRQNIANQQRFYQGGYFNRGNIPYGGYPFQNYGWGWGTVGPVYNAPSYGYRGW